jgi:hypothetical protein
MTTWKGRKVAVRKQIGAPCARGTEALTTSSIAADRRWLSAFQALPASGRCRTGRPNADRRLTPREIQPRDLFHPTVILIAGVYAVALLEVPGTLMR